jgi:hypothetical protein
VDNCSRQLEENQDNIEGSPMEFSTGCHGRLADIPVQVVQAFRRQSISASSRPQENFAL